MKDDDSFLFSERFLYVRLLSRGCCQRQCAEVRRLEFIVILHPTGEPILPHLLCCSAFAVENYSIIRCALHLRQPRLVNNPGYGCILTKGRVCLKGKRAD